MSSQTAARTAQGEREGLAELVALGGEVWIQVRCAMPRSGQGWAAAESHTGSQRFVELENRNGRLNTAKRRWGSSRASACLELNKDAVYDVGFGDEVRVTVSGTGIGIPPEDRLPPHGQIAAGNAPRRQSGLAPLSS